MFLEEKLGVRWKEVSALAWAALGNFVDGEIDQSAFEFSGIQFNFSGCSQAKMF